VLASADELWAWLYPALANLKQGMGERPDEAWEQRRARFLDDLGLADADRHPVTRLLLERLDELPAAERDRLLCGDELDSMAYEDIRQVADPDPAVEADPGARTDGGYDEAAWHEFLATELVRWDTAAESWPQFAQWLVYEAGQRGVGAPTAELVGYAGNLPNDDRIAALAPYGLTVPASTATVTETAKPDDAGVVLDDEAEAAMAQVLADDERFAAIPETRRRELVAELLRERAETY
jgi:hypothetical protein